MRNWELSWKTEFLFLYVFIWVIYSPGSPQSRLRADHNIMNIKKQYIIEEGAIVYQNPFLLLRINFTPFFKELFRIQCSVGLPTIQHTQSKSNICLREAQSDSFVLQLFGKPFHFFWGGNLLGNKRERGRKGFS